MVSITVYIREEIFNFLYKKAKETNLTVSEYIKRLILEKWREEHANTQN